METWEENFNDQEPRVAPVIFCNLVSSPRGPSGGGRGVLSVAGNSGTGDKVILLGNRGSSLSLCLCFFRYDSHAEQCVLVCCNYIYSVTERAALRWPSWPPCSRLSRLRHHSRLLHNSSRRCHLAVGTAARCSQEPVSIRSPPHPSSPLRIRPAKPSGRQATSRGHRSSCPPCPPSSRASRSSCPRPRPANSARAPRSSYPGCPPAAASCRAASGCPRSRCLPPS